MLFNNLHFYMKSVLSLGVFLFRDPEVIRPVDQLADRGYSKV